MQRLFSTFPGGLPGVGLLLLRVGLGGTLLAVSVGVVASGRWALAFIAGGCGAAVLVGVGTPFAAVTCLGTVLFLTRGLTETTTVLNGRLGVGLALVVSGALALLGPGALSIDARLFGRRELTFPRSAKDGEELP